MIFRRFTTCAMSRAKAVKMVAMLACMIAVAWGCTVKYSFTGGSIDPAAMTFSVAYIPNNAQYVAPSLSNDFTNALIERMERQTRLSQIPEGGDLSYEGEITSWVDAPGIISGNDTGVGAGAVTNKLTISVRIRFTNAITPDQNFDKSFSAYAEYPSTSSIMQEEANLIPIIVEDLVNQIFIAATANW